MLEELRTELKANVDTVYLDGAKNYFKEEINIYGVRIPVVRKISLKYFKRLKTSRKEKVFELCEELFSSGYGEESTVAFDWAFRMKKEFKISDFERFQQWLEKYVTDWSLCDNFCSHAFGELIYRYPELIDKTTDWCKSENRWFRRASAVILIYSIRRKNILDKVFDVCDYLLQDTDDLVRKGYGWLLKEAANKYPGEVFKYIMKNKALMPRVALRYAIEKYPQDMKKKAMEKKQR